MGMYLLSDTLDAIVRSDITAALIEGKVWEVNLYNWGSLNCVNRVNLEIYSTSKKPRFGPSTVQTNATIIKLIFFISKQVGAERKLGSPRRRWDDSIKTDFT
jgi:hypothetical protein